MKTSTLRLRSVRLKAGGAELRVLHNDQSAQTRREFEKHVAFMLDRRSDMVGYAIVAWSKDGTTNGAYSANGGPVPVVSIPRYAHDTLMFVVAS